MRVMTLILVVLSGCAVPPPVDVDSPATWTVTCTDTRGFHDSDTLVCVSAERGTPVVRLAGIDDCAYLITDLPLRAHHRVHCSVSGT